MTLICISFIAGAQTAADLVAEAEALMPGRYSIETMDAIIALYEEALALSPGDPQILGGLSKLWNERAILSPSEEREAARRKSVEYGFQAIGLPSFARIRLMKEEDFQKALNAVTDPFFLVWPARSWDSLLSSLSTTLAYGGVPRVLAMYRRAIELDESYHGGEALRSLGVLLASLSDHGVFGATLEEAKSCFERALAVGPDYLSNYVSYARSYAVRAGDATLFDRLLEHVMSAPVGAWPFWNENAKAAALRHMARRDEFFK